MLMNEVIAGEFGAANLAGKKLHVYVFNGRCSGRGRHRWKLGLKLSHGGGCSWVVFCGEIHCKRIQMTTFVLLIAIMRLENVVAKDTFVDGAAITFRLVGNYIYKIRKTAHFLLQPL